jgi:hypothetical protein
MNFKQKYLKYKTKYKNLKTLIGGDPEVIEKIKTQEPYHYFMNSRMMAINSKNLVKLAFKIYTYLLSLQSNIKKPISLLCCGSSPSYFCLSMMNLKKYDKSKVNILLFPFSSHIEKSKLFESKIKEYCNRLEEKKITLHNDVIIIDKIKSGLGIKTFETILKGCYNDIKIIKLISINAKEDDLLCRFLFFNKYLEDDLGSQGKSEIVNRLININKIKQYIFQEIEFFSNTVPRIIPEFTPIDFANSSKFRLIKNEETNEYNFDIGDNKISDMIIDFSKKYNGTDESINSNQWYKLNIERPDPKDNIIWDMSI